MDWEKGVARKLSFFSARPLMESYRVELKKILGAGLEKQLFVYTNGVLESYYPVEEMDERAGLLLSRLEEQGYIKAVLSGFQEKKKNWQYFAESLQNTSLKNKTSHELADLYLEFFGLFKQFVCYTPYCRIVDRSLTKKALELLEQKTGKGNGKATRYLVTLTTPDFESASAKEEKSLLKIAAEIQNSPQARHFSTKDPEAMLEEITTNKAFSVLLEEHEKGFRWLPVYLEGNAPYKKEHFAKLLCEILSAGIDAEEKLKELEAKKGLVHAEQERIASELKLDEKELFLFSSIRGFAAMKGGIPDIFSFCIYNAFPLFFEIASRLKISFAELKNLDILEAAECLRQGKSIPKKEIALRMHLVVARLENGFIKYFAGKSALALIKKELAEEKWEKSELLGSVASPGQATGTARIVFTRDQIGKIQKGDILVAPNTTPDFVVAMKKAAAIVTDEGGLTSHAAVLSREMGIPCIVGTLKATKVFKDGDRLLVDAEKGIVKKL